MKVRLFCLLIFCLSFARAKGVEINQDACSIVFVHIGDSLPDYLPVAIQQARLFNTCNILLVANASAIHAANDKLSSLDVVCVSCENVEKTSEHLTFLRNSKIDRSFRSGFWSHATERFFYLQDAIEQFKLTDVVHLESDNMLYVDISTLLPLFHEHYPRIGITLDNDQRCIPGFVYIRDAKSIDHLAQFIADRALSGNNDMQVLAEYSRCFGALYANQLPIILKEYVERNELVSPCGYRAQNKNDFCKNIDAFNSIFDAAALGQYLGGIDPRNGPSAPGFINESCVFNPALLSYTWKEDEKGRKIPFASYQGRELRMNNLHIHCKNLAQFLSK
jgi:hypothetical protein